MVGGFVNDENKRAGENAESSPFNLRLPHATRDALDAVAAQLPILSKHRIAVAALDIGLAALTANPAMVLSVKVAPSGTVSRGAAGASSSASVRGARGASSSASVSRGAAGASPNDHAPEEPPLVRAPSVPPRRATMPPAPNPSRYGSPLPALPSWRPPRVPADIVVPEAVELVDAAPEEPPLVRAPSVPPARASVPPPRVPVELVADAAQVPEAVELDDDNHEEPRAKHAHAVAAVRAHIAALQAADPKMSNKKIGALAGLSNAPVDKIMRGGNVRPATLAAIASILPPIVDETTT